jgi:hypothetical protein
LTPHHGLTEEFPVTHKVHSVRFVWEWARCYKVPWEAACVIEVDHFR